MTELTYIGPYTGGVETVHGLAMPNVPFDVDDASGFAGRADFLIDGESAVGAEVPDGSVDEVVGWVGNDPGRAAAALEVEQSRSRPRKSVIEPLTALVDEPETKES